eukprot:4201560-Karenia_brevis.AAC.1
MLNRRGADFLGLSKEEVNAWHECLCWLREPGNNSQLRLFDTRHERLVHACDRLRAVLRSQGVLPEGAPRTKIQFTKQLGRGAKEGRLEETLGEECAGTVVLDANCNPLTYDDVRELTSMVATQDYRLN